MAQKNKKHINYKFYINFKTKSELSIKCAKENSEGELKNNNIFSFIVNNMLKHLDSCLVFK